MTVTLGSEICHEKGGLLNKCIMAASLKVMGVSKVDFCQGF